MLLGCEGLREIILFVYFIGDILVGSHSHRRSKSFSVSGQRRARSLARTYSGLPSGDMWTVCLLCLNISIFTIEIVLLYRVRTNTLTLCGKCFLKLFLVHNLLEPFPLSDSTPALY